MLSITHYINSFTAFKKALGFGFFTSHQCVGLARMLQVIVAVGLQEKTIIKTRNNNKHTDWPGVTGNLYLDTHKHVTENIRSNRVMMIIIWSVKTTCELATKLTT